jgi:peptide/nickel transport system substrate-binding protein
LWSSQVQNLLVNSLSARSRARERLLDIVVETAYSWPEMRLPGGVAVAAAAILLAGCLGGDGDGKARKTDDRVPRGGTLRIGTVGLPLETIDPGRVAFDPALDELYRCCLLRTLVNYRGGTTEEGGAVLRPDLAVALPKVSADGLTYTFRLKPGLRYAPPYDDVAIRAQDVVRAIEYALRLPAAALADYPMLVIEGASDFQTHRAETIAGLETPDDRTLVVHVGERVGNLAERFSLALTAPVPPRTDVGADPIGRVPVASGPYMVAGSARFDYSRAPTRGGLPPGFVLGKRLTLVRNPSWRNDPLRAAYVDRIVLTPEQQPGEAAAKLDRGVLDIALGQLLPTPDQLERYSADPNLERRLFAHVGNTVRYIALNLAVPPFDDIHVRKAVNLAVDKQALRRTSQGGGRGARIAGHIAPDAFLNNLLLDYDPYETPGARGDLDAARKEMAKSRYDRDADGACDAAVCKGIAALVRTDNPTIPQLGRIVAENLRPLGLELDLEPVDVDKYFALVTRPQSRLPVIPALGVAPNSINASSVFRDLFYGRTIGAPSLGLAGSLVGASPQQLRKWKYRVTHVPNVDAKIDECLRLTGGAQTQCWAETDQLLMEKVVPWVPYLFEGFATVVSRRVTRFTYAQSNLILMPAFDRIALKRGSR